MFRLFHIQNTTNFASLKILNNMRQLKSIFIILLALALPSLAVAEQKSGEKKPRPPITLGKSCAGSSIKRPKAPDRQSITCTYDGTIMEFYFTVSEGISTLTVSDETLQCMTYIIDTSTLEVSVPVGILSGSISIELDTERGNHFTGVME